MTPASFWLIVKTLMILTPIVTEMVRDGKVKVGAHKEVLAALSAKLNERVKAAEEAEVPDEKTDPYNRDRH